MLKWFYKYNKILLVGFGSVLMVVFLLPGTDMFMPNPATQPMGTLNGETITHGDAQQAAIELDILKGRFPPLPESHPAHFPDDAVHWLLLLREAERNGIYVSQAEASLIVDNMPADQLANLLRAFRIDRSFVVRTFQHAIMWERLLDMVVQPDRASEPRLRHYAKDTRSAATVDLVVVDPTKMLETVGEPTDAQLREHFEKYKSYKPGDSEPYGFGYYLPDRVKLEYITVSHEAVAKSIEVDEIKANRYYLEHPERYMPPPPAPHGVPSGSIPGINAPDSPIETPKIPGINAPEKPAEQPKPSTDTNGDAPADEDKPEGSSDASDLSSPSVEVCQNENEAPTATTGAAAADADTSSPADEPAAPPAATEPLPYKQVRERVIEDVRNEEAEAKLNRIIKTIRARIEENLRGLARTETGYIDTSNHKPLSFEAIAKDIQEEFGVLPTVSRIDNRWLKDSDLVSLGSFGRAMIEFGGRPYPVARYVFSVRELLTDEERETHDLRPLSLQQGVPSQPVSDDVGDQHIFRVYDVSESHEPEKLIEVVEDVKRDWRKLQAYKQLQQRQDALLARAKTEGLKGIAESFDTSVRTPAPFPRRDERALMQALQMRRWAEMMNRPELLEMFDVTDVPNVQGVGRSEPFLDAVFQLAESVREKGAVTDLPAPQRTVAVPIDRQMRIALVTLTEYTPIDAGAFAQQKPGLLSDMRLQEMRDESKLTGNNPLSKDALARRLKYVEAGDDDEADADAGQANADTP